MAGGASLNLSLSLQVSPSAEGSEVSWTAEIDFGLLGRMLGGQERLLEVTEANVDKVIRCIGGERLTSP